jgi:oligoribonuclease NrnB/cAMP/cGMP phosphodiesterase (DHH superfamily)
MTREEAKKMARSRDCNCIKGKNRDNNYNECIDKIFDWHENEIKILTKNSLNLDKLEQKLDEALGKETRETLTEWIKLQRE